MNTLSVNLGMSQNVKDRQAKGVHIKGLKSQIIGMRASNVLLDQPNGFLVWHMLQEDLVGPRVLMLQLSRFRNAFPAKGKGMRQQGGWKCGDRP